VRSRNKSGDRHRSGIFRKTGGFTLLEILLAVFIFGIVMATLFGSFSAIFGNVETMENRASQYDMAKTCLDRMSEDLASLYITSSDMYPLYSSEKTEEKPDIHVVSGDNATSGERTFSRLRFSSFAHLPFEENIHKGVAQIIYYVQQVEGRYLLKRSDRLYPYPAAGEPPPGKNNTDPVLCMDMESFSIVYFDQEGKEHETWNSDSDEFSHATPKAIGIKLAIGGEPSTFHTGTTVLIPAYREKKEP